MEITQAPLKSRRWLALTWKVMMAVAAITAIYVGLTR